MPKRMIFSMLLAAALILAPTASFADDFPGTPGDDTITGTTGNDTITGGGGNLITIGGLGIVLLIGGLALVRRTTPFSVGFGSRFVSAMITAAAWCFCRVLLWLRPTTATLDAGVNRAKADR